MEQNTTYRIDLGRVTVGYASGDLNTITEIYERSGLGKVVITPVIATPLTASDLEPKRLEALANKARFICDMVEDARVNGPW